MENKVTWCIACGKEIEETSNFCPYCGAKRVHAPIRCKSCGAELEETNKFCPTCGTKNEQVVVEYKAFDEELTKTNKFQTNPNANKSQKKKKPLFKKWWFWLIIVLIIGAIGSGIDDNASHPSEIEAPAAEEPAAEEPAAPAAVETPAAQEKSSKAEKVAMLLPILESAAGDSFDYCKFEGDETGITVYVSNNGIAEAVTLAKSYGLGADFADWVSLRNSMVDLCDTISETVATFGVEDISVTLVVLNDKNHDNTLIMIWNGVIVYDVMEE